MPIYEYECPSCKSIREEMIKFKDANNVKLLNCDTCNKEVNMKKVISLSSFKLEGRGWAKDGYVNTFEEVKDMI